MAYIPDYIQPRTMKYEILHTLNLGSSFITLREQCNNQRPRCDIVWLHAKNNLYHAFDCLTVSLEKPWYKYYMCYHCDE